MRHAVNLLALLLAILTACIYLYLASGGLLHVAPDQQIGPLIVVIFEAETILAGVVLLVSAVVAREGSLGIIDDFRLLVAVGALVVIWTALGSLLAEFRKVR